ncbi:hypothetical protein ACFY7Z_07375 [Streptomyces sp. NPDC012623]|uniref:hypothetical protein n=1 Tax=unclassified Streptomyces TaxID=2593676 RepID=UPI00369B8072
MSFAEEWAQLRADAAQRRTDDSIRMALNSADGNPPSPLLSGGGSSDLVSTPAEKRAAASAIRDTLLGETKSAGDWAHEGTEKAVSGFTGWDTGAGLKTVQKTWESQVKTLTDRLQGEEGKLLSAAGDLQGADLQGRSSFSGINVKSPFDDYSR